MKRKTTPTPNYPAFEDIPAYIRKAKYPHGWKSNLNSLLTGK